MPTKWHPDGRTAQNEKTKKAERENVLLHFVEITIRDFIVFGLHIVKIRTLSRKSLFFWQVPAWLNVSIVRAVALQSAAKGKRCRFICCWMQLETNKKQLRIVVLYAACVPRRWRAERSVSEIGEKTDLPTLKKNTAKRNHKAKATKKNVNKPKQRCRLPEMQGE